MKQKYCSLETLCLQKNVFTCVFFLSLSSFVKKEKNDEDLVVELYCEEVNDSPSAPCSTCKDDCQQIVAGGKSQLNAFYWYSRKTWYDVRSVNESILNIISITIIIPTASCCHMKTTVINISSELVSQHVDTPAGESENYTVITCIEEETEQELTDMSSSEPDSLKTDEEKSSQAPEDMKDENKGQSVTWLHK